MSYIGARPREGKVPILRRARLWALEGYGASYGRCVERRLPTCEPHKKLWSIRKLRGDMRGRRDADHDCDSSKGQHPLSVHCQMKITSLFPLKSRGPLSRPSFPQVRPFHPHVHGCRGKSKRVPGTEPGRAYVFRHKLSLWENSWSVKTLYGPNEITII